MGKEKKITVDNWILSGKNANRILIDRIIEI